MYTHTLPKSKVSTAAIATNEDFLRQKRHRYPNNVPYFFLNILHLLPLLMWAIFALMDAHHSQFLGFDTLVQLVSISIIAKNLKFKTSITLITPS
jgi:hypothetical protein